MLGNIKKTAGVVSAANKVQSQKQKLENLLSSVRAVGQSKNGKIRITVTGQQRIVDIEIDPALIKFVYENFISMDKPDTMLGKSFIEAVDDALANLQKEIAKKITETAGSLDDLKSMIDAASQLGG